MVYLELFSFAVGLIVLLKGADVFVESAARIAKLVGISPFVIGLSLVAIGTSLPELAISIGAALNDSTELLLGNIIGSNITNIGLILAAGIMVGSSIKAEKKIFETDLFFLFLVSILIFYFSFDGLISFSEGVFLFLLFVFYLLYLFKFKLEFEKVFHFPSYLKHFYNVSSLLLNLKIYRGIVRHGLNPKTYTALLREEKDSFQEDFGKRIEKGERKQFLEEYKDEVFDRMIKNFYLFFISLIGIWIGSELTIKGALGISEYLNISQGVIGLTLVAVGTSLPELSVALSSAKKGYASIFLGNIIGSNIANILLVVGVSALITPLFFVVANFTSALVLMIIITVFLMLAIYGDWEITKPEAVILLFLYFLFLYSVYLTL